MTRFTVANVGIWEETSPLNSSAFRVAPLPALWNSSTIVEMAFSRSVNYREVKKQKMVKRMIPEGEPVVWDTGCG